MRNHITIVLGVLFLSGGSYGNPETYRDNPVGSHDSDLSVCLSRMEKLEERLDDLEDSLSSASGEIDIPNARKIHKSNVGDREYIIDTPEGCKMWAEYNQVYFQGCNVHIVNSSGLGGTEDRGDGLGNLIVGQNVCPVTNLNCRQYHPGYTQPGDPVDTERLGSHNIIVGNGHTWNEDAVNSVVFGLENHVKGPNSSILGGYKNVVTGDGNAIVGGESNSIINDTSAATITGGKKNKISNGRYSSILGGNGNEIAGDYSASLGGNKNSIFSDYSSIISGAENLTTGLGSVIVSGLNNSAVGSHALVLGGERNYAGGEFASVLNGYGNSALGKHAMVSTGSLNSAKGDYSFIATGGGGRCLIWGWHKVCDVRWQNVAEGMYSTIIGGHRNKTIGKYASILSGSINTAFGYAAVVVGGGGSGKVIPNYKPSSPGNFAVGSHSVVVGGMENRSYGDYSAVFGGGNNESHGQGSVVAGGGGFITNDGENPSNPGNISYGHFSLVAGGAFNSAGMVLNEGQNVSTLLGNNAVAVGGVENRASASRSCAVGGRGNILHYPIAEFGAAFGGVGNHISGLFSVSLGGKYNVSHGHAAVVGGGMLNWAFEDVSVIFGGLFNVAGVPVLDPLENTYPFLVDIDAGISNDRAGISIFGGYHNRAYDKMSTIAGGYKNVVGSADPQELYCTLCDNCLGADELSYYQPLSSPIVPRDCSTCQSDCRYVDNHTTAATITGGNDNNLGAGRQNLLYYPWMAGYGYERWYYEGCSDQYCN